MSIDTHRILITSALPYINGVKHLGNLAGSMLPADVYARVMRLRGHEVLYICATDEHGTPAELAAAEAGISVEAYCNAMHTAQREAGAAFDLSYDWFGRSSSDATAKLTQHFSSTLEQNGLIEARTSKQVYSNADGRYLPDRYVEGTCPNCAFEAARGDQCDNCGKLLDPIDLIDPYSSVSGSHDVEIRETEHLYLKQSDMSGKLRDWVTAQTSWPPLATSIAIKWLDEGLRHRSPLFGVKSFFSLSLLKRDIEKSNELAASIGDIQSIEDALPYEAHKKVRENIPVGVYNIIADFGQARGTNTATILPNEGHLSQQYGRTILIRSTVLRNPEIFAEGQKSFMAAMAPRFHPDLELDGDNLVRKRG